MKKLIALTLTVVMMLMLFASCNGNDTSDPNSTPKPGGNSSGTTTAIDGYVYVPEYIDLPAGINDMQYPKIVGDTIYFFQNIQVGEYTYDGSNDGGDGVVVPYDKGTLLRRDISTGTADDIIDSEEVTPSDGDDLSYTVPIYEQRLYKVNKDGSGFAQVEGYAPPPLPEGTSPDNSYWLNNFIIVDENSAWVALSGYFGYYDYDDDESGIYIDNNKTVIRRVDLKTGETLAELDLAPLLAKDQWGSVYYFAVDPSGNIALVGNDSEKGTSIIYLYSADGQLLFSCSATGADSWLNNLFVLPDGRIAAAIYSSQESKTLLKPLDLETKTLGDSLGNWPSNVWSIVGVSHDGKSLVYNTDTGLGSFEIGSDITTPLINWLDSDIDSSYISVIGFDDAGNIVALDYYSQWNYGGGGEVYATDDLLDTPAENSNGSTKSGISLVLLKKTPASEVTQKKVITLAVNYLDYQLREPILEFNKKDPDYRIKVISYDSYNTEADWSAGITKLNTEIISGNVPDLILLNQLPGDIYDSRGLLADLNPYLDADTELGGHDALLPALRNVLENDKGELTRLAIGFNVNTVIGNADIVGAENGWTTDEMLAVKANAPADSYLFSYYYTRQDMLTSLLYYNLGEYVNWETGETNFNSADFINTLEIVKTFPESYDWEKYEYRDEQMDLLNGTQLAQIAYIYSFDEVMRYNTLLNGKLAYKGYPCASENGHAIQLNTPIAMTVKCKETEGAWRFLRMLLDEDYQSNMWVFPSNTKAFEKKVSDAMKNEIADYDYSAWTSENETYVTDPNRFPGYTDNKDGSYTNIEGETIIPKGSVYLYDEKTNSSTIIPWYGLTQEIYDDFMELLNSINRTGESNDSISDIINEELGPFFNNQKSAQETAAIIQSRANIYVNEQR